MEKWIQEAISKWELHKVKLNPKANITDIEKAETIFNFKFPVDFKQLYLTVNGFVDYDWQEHMFSFWSLERMIDEYNENKNEGFIGFCDFLTMSNEIGYKKNQTGIFKIYSSIAESTDAKIAETFEGAIFMINNNSDAIY